MLPTAPFLNSMVPARAKETNRQLAEIRLVSHQRNMMEALRELGDGVEHLGHPAARGQRLENLDAGLASDAGDEQFGRVGSANQRTGHHELELDVELLQALDDAFETRDAFIVSGRSRSSG